ncbi:MAG: ribonuclease P protein component [Saprospiraceae bacterium]
MTSLSFPKKERLKSKKLLAALFKEGRSFSVYPIRVVWIKNENSEAPPIQLAVSVPKKRFKSAVDRNHIKRQIREAYRLQKEKLFGDNRHEGSDNFAVMLIYVSSKEETYSSIEKSIKKILNRLSRDFSKDKPK